MSANKFDPYALLELNRNCTEEEIKAAFKEKSMKYHPDRPGGDADKFSKCSDAKNLLMDKARKNMYDRGGWEAVARFDQMKQVESSRKMKCEPVNIKLIISLEQLYRREKMPIKVDIPGGETFQMDLPLDPGMVGHGICVEHRGISRPDCVTGDVIIHVELDEKRTPFKVNGLDLILEIKMQLADLLGYAIEIEHPSGTVYSIHGKYENPDENANIVYFYPDMGLKGGDDTGNMIVCIVPDISNLSKLPKKIIKEIQDLMQDSRKYGSDNVCSEAVDISEKALSSKQIRQRRGMPMHMGMPMQMPMPGAPGECKMS
jgi:DnaJ-class molecular chaperone